MIIKEKLIMELEDTITKNNNMLNIERDLFVKSTSNDISKINAYENKIVILNALLYLIKTREM